MGHFIQSTIRRAILLQASLAAAFGALGLACLSAGETSAYLLHRLPAGLRALSTGDPRGALLLLGAHGESPWFSAVSGTVLAGASLVMLVLAARRWAKPDSHPIAQALRRFGDPGQVGRSIDSELASPGVAVFGRTTLTRTWLVRSELGQLHRRRLDEIVWLYRYAPRRWMHSVVVHDAASTFLALSGSDALCESLLDALCRRLPWAARGYDDAKVKAWATSRQAFLAEVAERRRRGQAQDAEASPIGFALW